MAMPMRLKFTCKKCGFTFIKFSSDALQIPKCPKCKSFEMSFQKTNIGDEITMNLKNIFK